MKQLLVVKLSIGQILGSAKHPHEAAGLDVFSCACLEASRMALPDRSIYGTGSSAFKCYIYTNSSTTGARKKDSDRYSAPSLIPVHRSDSSPQVVRLAGSMDEQDTRRSTT